MIIETRKEAVGGNDLLLGQTIAVRTQSINIGTWHQPPARAIYTLFFFLNDTMTSKP